MIMHTVLDGTKNWPGQCSADFWVGRRPFVIFLVRDAELGCRVPNANA